MKALTLITTLCVCLFSTPILAKSKLPLEPGLWLLTDEIELDQAEIDKMLEQVPAEARQQAMAMMKQQGLGKESAPYKDCVTQKDLNEGLFNQGEQCKIEQKSHKGKNYVFSISCEDPEGEGKMEITIPNSKEYKSNVDMKIKDQGESKKIQITSKGKWLQKECTEED
jgi:hypothetical protein